MTSVTFIGVVLAFAVGFGVSFTYWHRMRSTNRTNATLRMEIAALQLRQKESDDALSLLRHHQTELDDDLKYLNQCLLAKPAGVGDESNASLMTYLQALHSKLAEQILQLEQAPSKSAPAVLETENEIKLALTDSKKERFTGFRDSLVGANAEINSIVRNLKEDLNLLQNFLGRLQSRRMDFAMGTLELEAISKVITSLDNERSKALSEEWHIRRKKEERKRGREYIKKWSKSRKGSGRRKYLTLSVVVRRVN